MRLADAPQLKCATEGRAAAARRLGFLSSVSRHSIRSAMDSGLRDVARIPFSPSLTIIGNPLTREAPTGMAQARASATTNPGLGALRQPISSVGFGGGRVRVLEQP